MNCKIEKREGLSFFVLGEKSFLFKFWEEKKISLKINYVSMNEERGTLRKSLRGLKLSNGHSLNIKGSSKK